MQCDCVNVQKVPSQLELYSTWEICVFFLIIGLVLMDGWSCFWLTLFSFRNAAFLSLLTIVLPFLSVLNVNHFL